ncbi:MAG TPA: hypothetical protein VKR60_02985 [Candidatus Sulfotelmatobacter sp.]|nr:hypothetical protein [Candidatus Sulfotelmatobacter sp.]
MNSIRKFAYAVALTLSALSIAPTPASAQETHGHFVLSHEVRWQNALVPAGEYEFSFKPSGPSELLFVRKLSGSGPGFMMLVNDVTETKPSNLNQLVLVAREGKSFVSTMALPEAGVTLHFAVPSETRQLASADAASASTTAR